MILIRNQPGGSTEHCAGGPTCCGKLGAPPGNLPSLNKRHYMGPILEISNVRQIYGHFEEFPKNNAVVHCLKAMRNQCCGFVVDEEPEVDEDLCCQE